mgnify:FL=1
MDKNRLAFGKTNFILIGVGIAIIIIGLLLMTGPNCTTEAFEPDIFSVRRIKVAPLVTLLGFVFIIAAIMFKSKDNNKTKE